MLTRLPSVLAPPPEPPVRSLRKLWRKDCNAEVSGAVVLPVVVAPDVAAVEPDVAPALLDVLVEPPRSDISLLKAELRFEIVFADRFEGAPAAAELELTTALLLKSLMSELSSETMPCWPYWRTGLLGAGAVAVDPVAGVVVAALPEDVLPVLAVDAVLDGVEVAADEVLEAAVPPVVLPELLATGCGMGAPRSPPPW